jgi:hypothetical protein
VEIMLAGGPHPMSPLQILTEIRQSWQSHARDRLQRYTATMTQVEALRVEVSALEAEIRRTEHASISPAYKDARIRGLAIRSAESYGRMLSLLREAADIYPSVVAQPFDIPHSFSRQERAELIQLPERPPGLGRRELSIFLLIGAGVLLAGILLTRLYPVLVTLP